jgi:hypothetical protein
MEATVTRNDFSATMAFLEAACNVQPSKETLTAYFEVLGDLDADVFRLAAKRVVLAHPWHTFPSVAELSQAYVDAKRGDITGLQPAEAWEMAWRAARHMDLELTGTYVSNGRTFPSQAAAAMNGLPDLVVRAMKAYGLPALVNGTEPLTVVRAQFMKIYEQLAASDRAAAALPASMRKALADRKVLNQQHGSIEEEEPLQRVTKPAPVEQAILRLGGFGDDSAATAEPPQAPASPPPPAPWDSMSADERSALREQVLAELQPEARARLLDRPEMLEACCRNRALSWRKSA